MSKKNQKEGKQANSLHKYFNKNNQPEDKNTQQTIVKNQGRKRICPNTHPHASSEENSRGSPTANKKQTLWVAVKGVGVDSLLDGCPKLDQVVTFLEQSVTLQRKVVKNILKKYMQANSHSLWSTKYSPSECAELFNVKAGHKIKDWLNAFFEYKNKICEESDSFLNDFDEEKSCRVYKNIRENQWQLLALVVRGRPGTGKSSAVRAIAHEMSIDLQQCGNHYNQTKYLKQKNESTQSESVKTAITRKIKLQKNAQMITKFMSPPVQREKTTENKKSQMIHNVGEIFPETEAHKFYNELSRCVQFSKIPFIMTDSCERLPRQCEKYDVIEYDYGSSERIEEILWIIYHIENLLNLNTLKEIEKEGLFEEINQQTSDIQVRQLVTLEQMHQICSLYNYRLDYIFTYLSQERHLERVNFRHLFIEKYKSYTKQKFLDEIALLSVPKKAEEEGKTSPDKSEELIPNTQDSQISEKGKEIEFYEHLRKLKIVQAQDTLPLQEGGTRMFTAEWQQDQKSCIQSTVHRGIKKSLIEKVNLQISSMADRYRSTLRISELQTLPMLIKQKRSSRNSKASDDAYHKFFTQNQCTYLQHFGHLIRNQ